MREVRATESEREIESERVREGGPGVGGGREGDSER